MTNLNSGIEINRFNSVDDSVKKIVWDGLRSYNDTFYVRNQMDFSVTVQIDDKIVAAAIGESKYEWLIIQYFYVEDKFRKNGIRSKILKEIVEIAKDRNCKGIHLDTFEFQARDFYVKQGFNVFGEIDDHPSGYKRYFMKMSI